MKELETSVLYNGKVGSTKDCMMVSLGISERDKVTMHKPICSLMSGLILETKQKEFSRAKKIKIDSRRKPTLKGIKKQMIYRHKIST